MEASFQSESSPSFSVLDTFEWKLFRFRFFFWLNYGFKGAKTEVMVELGQIFSCRIFLENWNGCFCGYNLLLS